MHGTGGLSIYRAWPMLEYRTQLGLAEREDTQNWIKPKNHSPCSWGGVITVMGGGCSVQQAAQTPGDGTGG